MQRWPTMFRRSYTVLQNARKMVPRNGDRVVVAMSGGVDSSVVAKMLSEEQYDLSAVFMRNWDTRDESGTDRGCEWEKDWEDVQRVCSMLDIPCKMVDLSREYWTRVFEPSLRMWEAGATPNPDIWCNKEVKFGALFDSLSKNDAWLATGHYAKKGWSPKLMSDSESHAPRSQLLRPLDRSKDQTYYLSAIPESGLARTLFPLEDLTKKDVRALAEKWGLPTAKREESMGICFVGEKRRFDDFISQYIRPNPGPIIDLGSGNEVGTHNGLWQYTIGQGAKIRGMPQKMFVARKDPQHNRIYVVAGSNHPELYSAEIKADDWRWIWADSAPAGIDTPQGFCGRVQFRHRMPDVPCTVYREDGSSFRIVFHEPQKAVAAGQIAALWDGAWCLGCGTIT